jgi:hypothetical protein
VDLGKVVLVQAGVAPAAAVRGVVARVAVVQVTVRRLREPGADLMVAAEVARRVLCPGWLPDLREDLVVAEASRRKKNFLEFSER